MPLTPEDVSNKRFTTVRLREGYDMTEVDQFLDEVEAALATMNRENDELRKKLEAAQRGEPVGDIPPAGFTSTESREADVAESPAEPTPEPSDEPTAPEDVEEAPDVPPAPAEAPAQPVAEEAPAPQPAAAAVETLQVTTTAEASVAATRLLELAGRNADELVLGAREQADEIVGTARANADRLEAEAQERSETLDRETEERRTELLSQLEREKDELNAEITNLRTFEREYRAQLRSYFEQQLEALDSHGEGGSLAEPLGHGPSADQRPDEDAGGSPLQSLLAEEGEEAAGDGAADHNRDQG